MSEELLFNTYDIYGVVQGRTESIKKRVNSIPPNTLLGASEHDLIQVLVEEFRLNVPVIKEDEIHVADSGEVSVDVSGDSMRMIYDRSEPFYVPGNKTVIAVPFEGQVEFFRVQPRSFSLSPPRAEIDKGELLLTYVRTNPNAEEIKRSYQGTINSIKEYLRSLSESVAQFNDQLQSLITAQLKARKERLLADAGMTAALGLPMKKREGAPATYSVPVTRRVPKIEQIKVAGAFKPEPALSAQDYQEILRIMKNMVHVMELSPHAFSAMGEEDLRSHFLVQLNGAFQGQATGETFNFQGKTDILIRVDGKNIFIAECKFWKGEKSLIDTIDQLLSYLSWRDTKAAVIVFNRNADFSAVLAKIAETAPKHSGFKRDLGKEDESTFRYVFVQPNDSNREIALTVMAFDIPTASVS
ncbi:GNAT family N-acetyltransferase [Acidicapsa acidisoli]|uniref:GNAT family N-acetyltransferase n=1 Tax=Acidicapsa acidisoli TaxID=1615681 RepID=UPI0021E0709B|nr:GNAT family N-acetyltransferase [Acidicapsa acidisoli]